MFMFFAVEIIFEDHPNLCKDRLLLPDDQFKE